ncbi:MAG: hypothetical protein ACF8R7_18020 [Phycisphaerales bacterium JB039]
MNLLIPIVAGLALAGANLGTPATPGAQPAGPQPAQEVRTADVTTIDGVMTALYESISGPAGQPRDWDRLRSLCRPDTRFVAARTLEDGRTAIFALSVDDFVMHNRKYFERGGYFETEVARRAEEFGNIAHIWSTYESRRQADADPYLRGIYSVQLLKDKDRWWLISVYWDYEREDNPMPAKYLKSPDESSDQ